MKLTESDLVDLARGAAFLGTGGGGDPYIGQVLAAGAIKECGMPKIIEPDELADDALVFTIAMVGAPTVLSEKGACGEDVDLAIATMEKHLGRKADALLPIEIGGVNSMLPIMAAARSQLPLVNMDGMGRAFPELQMVTFNVYGVSCTPACVTDEHLNSLIIETGHAKRAEDLVRVSSIEMGCSVIMSSYSMTGKQAKDYGVHGTLTMALEIGRAIKRGQLEGSPIDELIGYLRSTPYYNQCSVLFDGKVTDLRREVTDGFTMGHCILSALDGSERTLEVNFQNEFLIAKEGNKLLAIVPDLLAMVD